jgi:hypothetical protein
MRANSALPGALSGLQQNLTPALRLLQVKSALSGKAAVCPMNSIVRYLIDFLRSKKNQKKIVLPPSQMGSEAYIFPLPGTPQALASP